MRHGCKRGGEVYDRGNHVSHSAERSLGTVDERNATYPEYRRVTACRAWPLRCMKHTPFDKKKLLREQDHLTRPPRLEGKVKNAMMNPVRKPKKKHI